MILEDNQIKELLEKITEKYFPIASAFNCLLYTSPSPRD